MYFGQNLGKQKKREEHLGVEKHNIEGRYAFLYVCNLYLESWKVVLVKHSGATAHHLNITIYLPMKMQDKEKQE